jgi:hypothetical protein
MSDLNEQLLETRYVGVPELPEAGDAGDRRLRKMLEQELAGNRPRRFGWARRRIRVGGFAVAPVAVLAVVATAAAATTAVVTLNATTLFQNDPQAQLMQNGKNFNGDIEAVLPSTVRELTTVSIPDYGQVAVWGATTKPGGFCFAMKLPDGDWGGLHTSQDSQNGWNGGSIPGCFQTRQQQILKQTPLKSGQQPSGKTGQLLLLTPVEEWDNEVKNGAGKQYTIYTGYVEVQGTATTVRDPATGATAQVLPGGYYALAEPSNSDDADLQALNAAGQPLKPDYTWGGMLPGYSAGPSQS